MTDKTETELLPVTREDREAAADFAQWLRDAELAWKDRTAFFVPSFPTNVRKGIWDNHGLTQAFARHRINSRNAEYICTCGLRVEPHRCRDTKGEF